MPDFSSRNGNLRLFILSLVPISSSIARFTGHSSLQSLYHKTIYRPWQLISIFEVMKTITLSKRRILSSINNNYLTSEQRLLFSSSQTVHIKYSYLMIHSGIFFSISCIIIKTTIWILSTLQAFSEKKCFVLEVTIMIKIMYIMW